MKIENNHVRCQDCIHLRKIPYIEAIPTHHENWECSLQGCTMQYEFTVGYIQCNRFKPTNSSVI